MPERDYRQIVAALRVKARDAATTVPEREALNAKADELEKKYLSKNKSGGFIVGDVTIFTKILFDTRAGQVIFDEWFTDIIESPEQNEYGEDYE